MGIKHAFRVHYPPGLAGKSLFVYIRKNIIKRWIYYTRSNGTINPRRCTENRLAFKAWLPFVTSFDGGVTFYGVRSELSLVDAGIKS